MGGEGEEEETERGGEGRGLRGGGEVLGEGGENQIYDEPPGKDS